MQVFEEQNYNKGMLNLINAIISFCFNNVNLQDTKSQICGTEVNHLP